MCSAVCPCRPGAVLAAPATTSCAVLVTVMGVGVALLVLLLLAAALFLSVLKPASKSALLILLLDDVDSDLKCVLFFLLTFLPQLIALPNSQLQKQCASCLSEGGNPNLPVNRNTNDN